MLDKISEHIKQVLNNFTEQDSIIFNNTLYEINKNKFNSLTLQDIKKSIAFVDGGQAEIIASGNFCLSFIRVYAVVFQGNQKIKDYKNEFYLFTKAVYSNNDIVYESTVFPITENIITEEDLRISSTNDSIKTGLERAPITKVTNIARRFAELSLAKMVEADFVVLDGTLEATYQHEQKYLDALPSSVCALAKSSSLFTTTGNSPIVLLDKIGPQGMWFYQLNLKTVFVKLHHNAKHVFRFEGSIDVLPPLLQNCTDALFLGYPYGLIFADKMARVSNTEKKSLKLKFLLKKENQEIAQYLSSSNAHDILDTLG